MIVGKFEKSRIIEWDVRLPGDTNVRLNTTGKVGLKNAREVYKSVPVLCSVGDGKLL